MATEEARVAEISRRFEIPGAFRGAARHGSGHIHDTFVANYEHAGSVRRYLHQRLNAHVFRDPIAVMHNALLVTKHLRDGLAARGVRDASRRCLTLVPARDARAWVVDEEGAVWRTLLFIERSHALDTVSRPSQAHAAARAFGAFVAALADLDPGSLAVTIPGFHDLAGRVRALEVASDADPEGRGPAVRRDLEQTLATYRRLEGLLEEAGFGGLPRRVVHNDCKLNNVLLDDQSGEPLCVIDLDTVMEGSVLCDFGDLVRTATCPSPEDTRDLDSIVFDTELFRATASGYRAGAGDLLTQEELCVLPLSGPALALENAARFLADHFEGDVYFRIHRPGHNLDRCRAQLRLAERMLEALEPARRIVAECG